MSANYTIKFTTTPVKGNTDEGKICYQGQLQHNKALSVSDTRRLFAEYANAKEPQSNLYLDLMGAFMTEYLAKGYRLNFGTFSVGLSLHGSFPASNAPFDEKVNSISVDMKPSAKIKSATASLDPVNVTFEGRCCIDSVYQMTPYEEQDVIACDGERTLIIGGRHIWVHSSATGEGVWIENDLGVKMIEGTVTSADTCQVQATFTGHINAGRYWIVTASRDLFIGNDLLTARRRITAK